MPEHSQNGWPVLDRSDLTWFSAAGGRFAAANDDVAHLASYLINRFNNEVEPIPGRVLDDWSYANRPVTGSTTSISNHASATAWDLNATQHPRGVKGTFSAAQIKAVRRILADIVDDQGREIFRWGQDYKNSPIDSMHFEINATRAQVAQARALLEDKDMQWNDKIKLTPNDAKYWGAGYKEGDEVTIGNMLRYPTLLRKVEQEMVGYAAASAARDKAIMAQLDELTKAVADLTVKVDALADPEPQG